MAPASQPKTTSASSGLTRHSAQQQQRRQQNAHQQMDGSRRLRRSPFDLPTLSASASSYRLFGQEQQEGFMSRGSSDRETLLSILDETMAILQDNDDLMADEDQKVPGQ